MNRKRTPAVIGALVLALACATAAAQDTGFTLTRIAGDAPEYPRKAYLDGTEGWVDLKLTVAPDGSVENVEIVDAEPRRVFERAAIRAAARWRFSPPADAGLNESQSGVIRVHFRIER